MRSLKKLRDSHKPGYTVEQDFVPTHPNKMISILIKHNSLYISQIPKQDTYSLPPMLSPFYISSFMGPPQRIPSPLEDGWGVGLSWFYLA
jgi:hypothetical protein